MKIKKKKLKKNIKGYKKNDDILIKLYIEKYEFFCWLKEGLF
ncbi:hypothetical protein [Staphylococcus aureus]|nr:hypothetical protein [Staphylococcus aureus]